MKKRMRVNCSGGETSMYMARRLQQECSDQFEFLFIFANTSQENEQTLEFVHQCDQAWGLGVVMVEAVVNPKKGEGTRHKVVTFETAARNGEVFEEVIKKYGVPNIEWKPCNREMKFNTMDSYTRSIGWNPKEDLIAIGIRSDEASRVDVTKCPGNFVYPFKDWWPTDKQDVHTFWEDQPFRLNLREHEGNCKWCFEKSDAKLFTLIAERPDVFDFPRRMEKLYGFHGAPHYGSAPEGAEPRKIYRHHRTTDDLFAEAEAIGCKHLIRIQDGRSHAARQHGLDFEPSGCGSSCQPYPMIGEEA